MIDDSSYKGSHIYKFDQHTLVFLCDGNIRALNDRKIIFAANKMIGFLCGDHHFEQCKMNKNITYLQDYRIYGQNKFFNSYDYVKKLPFKYYKLSNKQFDNSKQCNNNRQFCIFQQSNKQFNNTRQCNNNRKWCFS